MLPPSPASSAQRLESWLRPRRLHAIIVCGALASLLWATAALADPLHVYGPGGPAPAMREAAETYTRTHGREVTVVAGPTPQWLADAKLDADVVFSGSETMMTDFVTAMEGRIEAADVEPLYLRRAAILVRPGNPDGIEGMSDLFEPGHRIVVVNGAGQDGLWEDMAGRAGDIRSVRALRKNIAVFSANSGEAKAAWIADPTLDAWIIWNIWQVANPEVADQVEVEEPYRIYRDAGAVVTTLGREDPDSRKFLEFLQSPAGAEIFRRWGWMTDASQDAPNDD